MLIFVLRLIIFFALVFLGFHISCRSVVGRKIVTLIYVFTLLYYTFLCRLPLFTGTSVSADDFSSVERVGPTTAEKVWKIVKEIWGMQPDGHLAGIYWQAFVLNVLLFVPLSYLLLLWIPALRKSWRGRAVAILITMIVSVAIEALQSLTGLGMADPLDTVANGIGGIAGVLMILIWERKNGP